MIRRLIAMAAGWTCGICGDWNGSQELTCACGAGRG